MTELRHVFNFRDNYWHKTCTQRGVSEAVSVKINFDPRKKKKLTPQNVLETLAEDSVFPHCSKVTKSILCLRSGQSEALKRLDGHHLRLPQLVTGKPRTFLRSGYSRKALDSCSVAAQTYSSYSSLAQKICASEFHTAKFWVHMLKARPRRRFKAQSSLPLLQLVPTAGTTLALPHTAQEWGIERNRGGAFKSAKLPGGGKTVHKGLVGPMVTSLAPQQRGFTPLK